MLEYLRKTESASFTFIRVVCHIADLMEGDLKQCRQYIVRQDALLETIIDHFQGQKNAVIDKELGDFDEYKSSSEFMEKISIQL